MNTKPEETTQQELERLGRAYGWTVKHEVGQTLLTTNWLELRITFDWREVGGERYTTLMSATLTRGLHAQAVVEQLGHWAKHKPETVRRWIVEYGWPQAGAGLRA